MYEEIESNKRKSLLLILLFISLIIFIGYVIGLVYNNSYVGLTFGTLFSLFYCLIMYYSGDSLVLALNHAKEANRTEHLYLINTVEGLSIAAGIVPPKCYVIEDSAINAFATGRDIENSAIAVTKGALDKLNRQELEGVVAHEISHIKNYDIRLMLLTVVLVNVLVLLSDFLLRSMWFSGERDNSKQNVFLILFGLVMALLSPILAQLIRFAISRKREFLADASAALLTRYPKGLSGALKKIRDENKVLNCANKATAHLYFSAPFKNNISTLFSTHPDINKRIEILDSM